jgi:serine/threonine-protein kinase
MTDSTEKQRYLEAKSIVTAALDRATEDRAGFIESRCGSDADLRREVDWLLAAAEDDAEDDVPESFQSAARDALKDVSLQVPLPRNYRLIRRISQGGSGIVYLAERVDGDLRQPVAFKLLHFSDSEDPELQRRFSTERGILSRLNHPAIAHLVDGGLTADGRPFLATEYIAGERIDKWASEPRSLADLLEVFIEVCEAVDYAHRHMVIHGDIKPANVLVTHAGRPKLLDFGVARLLDSDSREEHDASALTLAYASPEQWRGEALGAATDVYGLGALLHELLDGRPPFDPATPPAQLRDAVLSGQRVSPHWRHGGRLPPDLSAVVGKAMDRDPAERYASVGALVEDLRRFRSHRPVRAHGGGSIYRLLRFARRHRVALALGALASGLLVAFTVDREMQYDRIAWERDRAESVTRFMTELLAGADALPTQGNNVTVRDVLELGVSKLPENRSANPSALGEMYRALGEAYNALGLGEQAVPLLEQARDVLAGRLSIAEQARLAASLGAAYDSAGRASEAIAADGRAIDLYERSGSADAGLLTRLAIRRLRNQVNVLQRRPQAVIEDLEALVGELEADRPGALDLLFEARAALVGARVAAGRPQAALDDAASARDLAERLYGEEDPRRLRGRYVYATALMQSDPEAAVAMFETLIADHERLVGPSQRLANTIGNLGVALSRLGRNEESMQAFERSAAMIESSVGRDHYLYRLSMTNLAALRLRVGQAPQAERLIRAVLPVLQSRHDRIGGVETLYRASALEVLGGALAMQGRLEEAENTYRSALASIDQSEDAEWATVRERLAGKLEEIRRAMQRES